MAATLRWKAGPSEINQAHYETEAEALSQAEVMEAQGYEVVGAVEGRPDVMEDAPRLFGRREARANIKDAQRRLRAGD